MYVMSVHKLGFPYLINKNIDSNFQHSKLHSFTTEQIKRNKSIITMTMMMMIIITLTLPFQFSHVFEQLTFSYNSS